MRSHLNTLLALCLVSLVSPLVALAQEATPPVPRDLSTQAGLNALYQDQRQVSAKDVDLPDGFTLQLVAQGLSFPDAVAVGPDGTVYAALSGFGGAPAGIVALGADGRTTTVLDAAAAGLTPPLTDLTFGPDGTFYVAYTGGIATVDLTSGTATPILTGLPSLGDHENNQLAFSRDGWVYFGQGTATNSMVVGPDNLQFGWLPLHPAFHDTPCRDVTLAGKPFESPNVLTPDNPNDVARTSPYQPFGTAVNAGTVVKGAVLCNGAVLRFKPSDPAGTLELFAWGFRNPYGVTIDPTGAIWVIDNGADERGSRPLHNAPDSIYRLTQQDRGAWYGYPDFEAGIPVTDPRFAPATGPAPSFIIANHAALLGKTAPPKPVATWEPHYATGQGAVAPPSWGDMAGNIFVAHHGDFAPVSGVVKAPVGFEVDRVEQESGKLEDFLKNPHPGPAGGEPERPVGVSFAPDGSLYVADLGVIETSTAGLLPRPQTGAIWRVIPSRLAAATPGATPIAPTAPATTAPTTAPTAVATVAATTVATTATTSSPVASPAASAGTVAVALREFTITMPTSLPAGTTTFRITNDGTITHSFEIEGQGIEKRLDHALAPGETATLTVTLTPGSYEAYCPIDGHKGQGMDVKLAVT